MDLEIFDYEGNQIRMVMRDGEPWFVAADVCRVLDIGNPTNAIKRLSSKDFTLSTVKGSHRPVNLVNESGLYDLILDSRKPGARRFRRWVTSEVLPTIRRTGGAYVAPDSEAAREMLSNPLVYMERVLEIAKELKAKLDESEAEVEELRPRAQLMDDLFKAGPVNIRSAARWLGEVDGIHLYERQLTALLREWGWIEKVGTAATARSRKAGYMVNRLGVGAAGPWTQGRITQKGFDFLLKKLYRDAA